MSARTPLRRTAPMAGTTAGTTGADLVTGSAVVPAASSPGRGALVR